MNDVNDFYKVYDIVAEVKTPIFVGSGEKLLKKDYYVDEKENKIYVVDVNKLIRRNNRILSLYEEYVKDINKTFNEWIKDSSIRLYLNEEIIKKELTIYTIDRGNADIRGGSKQINTNRNNYNTTDIEKFIKNPYNEVYLPGSSIKGAMRLAMLSSSILNETDSKNLDYNIKQIEGVIKSLSDRSIKGFNSKNIEKQYFNKLERDDKKTNDAVNDIFSYISVSDSEPIDINSLVLCEKIDIYIDKDKNRKEKKLKLIRETLKPKAEIKFKINIQNDKNVFKMDEILERIKTHSKYYLEYYNKNFKLQLNNYNGIYLPIGGGVGYISKTIVDDVGGSLEKMNANKTKEANLQNSGTILQNVGAKHREPVVGIGAYYISQILGKIFYSHKHYNDYKIPGFAPRLEKSTKYDNQLVPMGLLEIKKIFEPKTSKYILNI